MFSLKQPSLFPWEPRTCLRARKKTRNPALGLPTRLFTLTAALGGQTCARPVAPNPGVGVGKQLQPPGDIRQQLGTFYVSPPGVTGTS